MGSNVYLESLFSCTSELNARYGSSELIGVVYLESLFSCTSELNARYGSSELIGVIYG